MRLVPTRRRLFSGILTLAMIGGLLVLSAAPAWAISSNPTSLDFGKVRVGAQSELLEVTISFTPGFTLGTNHDGSVLTVTGGLGFFGCLVSPGSCAGHLVIIPTSAGPVGGDVLVLECPVANPGCIASSGVIVDFSAEGVANAAPVCQDVSNNVIPNTPADLNLPCTDTDPITYAVITPPQHGTVTLTPATGAVNYVPNAGYTGPDSFTYQADDGLAYPASNVATANINVRPKPDHPSPSPTPTPTFVLNLAKAGGGRVTSDPAGINCGNDCTGDFAEGTQVTLTAKAHAGWEFKRWRYRCKGQGKVCTIR